MGGVGGSTCMLGNRRPATSVFMVAATGLTASLFTMVGGGSLFSGSAGVITFLNSGLAAGIALPPTPTLWCPPPLMKVSWDTTKGKGDRLPVCRHMVIGLGLTDLDESGVSTSATGDSVPEDGAAAGKGLRVRVIGRIKQPSSSSSGSGGGLKGGGGGMGAAAGAGRCC